MPGTMILEGLVTTTDPAGTLHLAAMGPTIDDAERVRLYRAFQKQVTDDVALVNVAEFSFITVARDNVLNVSNNPRWAVSNWADTGFAA